MPGLATGKGRERAEAQLFETEVERAIAREGGREALEERRSAHFRDRRSARRGEFESYRESARSTRDAHARPSRDAEEDALAVERVPVDPNPRPTPTGNERAGGSDSVARDGAAARTTASETSTNTGDRSRGSVHPELADASGAGTSDVGASATPSNGRAAGATTASPELTVPRVANARPGGGSNVGVQAFLGTERTPSASSTQRAPSASGHVPDPELIEQAEKVLRQIRMNLRPGARQVTLNLDPVELGRLSIDLRVDRGRVAAVVRAESPETLELLKRQAPELRAVLAQQGFETDRLDLHLAFENGGGQSSAGEHLPSREHRAAAPDSTPARALEGARIAQHTGRLDEDGVDTLA